MAAHSEYRSIIEGLQRWEIAPNDPSYPPALLDLGHEAPVLHGYGDPSVLSGECISIVGARKATPYGRTCAKMAGRAAAECGITVVSGGAIGCDQCAGTAALDAGGKDGRHSGVWCGLRLPILKRRAVCQSCPRGRVRRLP